MHYFAIEYPNHTTLIIKANLAGGEFIHALKKYTALKVHGVYYNPSQYLSIREIKNVDERQERVSSELSAVVI